MKLIGTVGSLWMYPVKSMLGEQRDEIHFNTRGVAGDRLYAVRDDEGKFGSGKDTRRFRKIDGLFNFRAYYDKNVPQIVFPDGQIIEGDNPLVHTKLSQALNKQVTLGREEIVSHFDAAAVHLLTSASLNWLKEKLLESIIDERRFRPNLLIKTAGCELMEQNWLGKTLKVGKNVRLEITHETERCVMTTFAQSFLPEDKRIFALLGREAKLNFGVYAKVICGGSVSGNDEVSII